MNGSGQESPIWRHIVTWPAVLAVVLGLLCFFAAHALEEPKWVSNLLDEISAAMFVALFVWAFFEVISHSKQQQRMEDLVKEIARGVFFGVLRKNLPPELLEEAKALVLDAQVVRTNFSIHHTIIDDTYMRDGGPVAYVKLRAVATFTYYNISERNVEVPIAVALPNPIVPQLLDVARVEKVTVQTDGEPEEVLDLTVANIELRKAMEDTSKTQVRCDIAKKIISPNKSLEVSATYIMAKEVEDTEVITALWPADGLRLTVHDTAPDKRLINARSIHRMSLIPHCRDVESGTYIFDLKSYVLPHQGLIVWWKARPKAPVQAA